MSDDLFIKTGLTIPGDELEESHSRSGGPGGQHVNTSSTKVTIRWNVVTSRILPYYRERIIDAMEKQLTNDGDLLASADGERSQLQNKEAARARLAASIKAALYVPKARLATKPSRSSQRERVEEKKARGETKKMRGKVDE